MLLCGLPVPDASAQGVSFDTGLTATSGDYGFTEITSALSWSNGVTLEWSPVSVSVGIPVVVQKGDAVLTGAGTVSGRRAGTGGSTGMMSGSSGRVFGQGTALEDYRVRIGDALLSGSVRVLDGVRTSVSTGVSVKAPLAEAGDVGTGKWDAGVTLDATRHLSGVWFGAAGLAWWKLGDPEGLDLRDPLLGSLMLTRMGDGESASLLFFGSTPIADGLDPPMSGGVRVARDLWGGSVFLSAALGLTDTAADFTLGVGWSAVVRQPVAAREGLQNEL